MILNGDYAAGLHNSLEDSLTVDGLDGVHIKNSDFKTVRILKEVSRLESLECAGAASDNGDVGALFKSDCLAELEAVIGVLIEDAVEASVDSDIERAGGLICRTDCVDSLHTVCGADNGEVGHSTGNCEIADSVMGRACLTERSTRMGSDYFSVDILIADVGVELVGASQRSEDREGRKERNESCSRHTCGDAEHVLLCDTDVEESVRISLTEHTDLC